ncbi:unnamed protein product [Darwinula stevensoni]|uniref:non-specific serine/threonine protein kinase n=1 Tax=Darwinula stevensoni TaxID=69355 RepID=A0A7R8X6F4_9CRUS|nr:unnamed protein product [Darwinula stevensoni]CAG0887560.1 unnamed protein product [Darwinula stevensoni]
MERKGQATMPSLVLIPTLAFAQLQLVGGRPNTLTVENVEQWNSNTSGSPMAATMTSNALPKLQNLSTYQQKALAAIRNSLQPYDVSSASSTTSGISSASYYSGSTESSAAGAPNGVDPSLIRFHVVQRLVALGYEQEACTKILEGRPINSVLEIFNQLQGVDARERKQSSSPPIHGEVMRKVQEERLPLPPRGNTMDPPPPPPRGTLAPPPPPTPPPPPSPASGSRGGDGVGVGVPTSVAQMLKRMSPTPVTRGVPAPSIPLRQPVVLQNGPHVQQQLNQQLQAWNMAGETRERERREPPPPYPSMAQRTSGSPSPTPSTSSTGSTGVPIPPHPAWGGRQTRSQPPIIMHSVRSVQVQKPILQTAVAPSSPMTIQSSSPGPPLPISEPPSYHSTIQAMASHNNNNISPANNHNHNNNNNNGGNYGVGLSSSLGVHVSAQNSISYSASVNTVSCNNGISNFEHGSHGNYGGLLQGGPMTTTTPVISTISSVLEKYAIPLVQIPVSSPLLDTESSRSESPVSSTGAGMSSSPVSFDGVPLKRAPPPPPPPTPPSPHVSPIPQRKKMSKEKEEERLETKVRNYSPQAFKFYMEQHVENVLKQSEQRHKRRTQLECEMAKVGLSEEAQEQIRKVLFQKESNYIRLKRAKMDKSMFRKIKTIGVGAFGEVALVKKLDGNGLYAMKTLRKTDVLKRNQVAHVKAERDILAEANCEWVVKLYYSFQDRENLYFVMDYIPGGDLMSLLIRFGIFSESLARFYVAELVCAIESVHRMGFIHRDIKPDNILIDFDGHIKLTDFGLCTGFRWTHNSKYYQRNGAHVREDSMDPGEGWSNECHCNLDAQPPALKPLERRKRREHQRCLAHSLVGTPNYIAPEVLNRVGYSQLCDWWSVGVILYEMLVGQPPFLANTPAETQLKVINWETTLRIPKAANLSMEARDLILKLCTSQEKRLGKNGADEVKQHAMFASVDFISIRNQRAPYLPKIRYATDTSNFDPVDPEKLRTSDSSEEKCLGRHPEDLFFEFTFRRFFESGDHVIPLRVLGSEAPSSSGSPIYV